MLTVGIPRDRYVRAVNAGELVSVSPAVPNFLNFFRHMGVDTVSVEAMAVTIVTVR